MNCKPVIIFTDAATSPQKGIAVGAFLYLDQHVINNYAEFSMEILSAKLANQIVYLEYQSKKSTWSEIKTVIHALAFAEKHSGIGCKIELYTDCQSVCDLLGQRKEKLKNSHFITRTGKVLNNADLYKELFELAEKFQIQTFKIKGHNTLSRRLTLQEKIFDVLDKCSRQQLRSVISKITPFK